MRVKKQKFLSLILIISMFAAMLQGLGFAADSADGAESGNGENVAADTSAAIYTDDIFSRAAGVLAALGIMKGKSEDDFGAEDSLTRAEMCTVAVRFMGMDSESGAAQRSGYTDVAGDHWARFYIDTASVMGIVAGNGDGTFRPDDTVTGEQAVKILVCALGYEPKAQDKGGFPSGYTAVATEIGLLKGVKLISGDTPITRRQIAILTYNALDAELMEQKVYGRNAYTAVSEDKTALTEYQKTEKKRGTVTAVYGSSLDGEELREGEIMIDGERYKTALDTEGYLGQYVEYYVTIEKDRDERTVIAMFSLLDSSNRTEIDFEDVDTVRVSDSLDIEVQYFDKDGTKSKTLRMTKPTVMYNGKAEEFADAEAAQAFLDSHMKDGRLCYLKNDKKGQSDVLFVENYEAYVVSRVDAENKKIVYNVYSVGKTDTKSLDLSDGDTAKREVLVYDENGTPLEFSDLARNDVIMVYASSDRSLYKIYRSQEKVTGKITRIKQTSGTRGNDDYPDIPEVKPYWETLAELDMNGFNLTANSTWQIKAEKTVDERTVTLQTNAGADPWIVCPDSGFCDVASDMDLAVDVPEITENGKLFVLNRNKGLNGWWRPTSVKSGIQALNLFDKTKIKYGDKIKITAYVYAKNICKGEGNYNNSDVDQKQNVSARIWLTEPWKSNSEPGYNTNCDPLKESFIGEIPAGEWTELSLEYTASNSNMNVNGIEMNNYPGSKEGIYPIMLYVAGIKAERYVDPNAGRNPNTEPRPEIPVDPSEYAVYIDGQKYTPVSSFPSSLLELGNSVTLYLDLNGKIVGYTKSLSNAGYGLLLNAGIDKSGMDTVVKVRILDTENNRRTYELAKEVNAYNGKKVTKMAAETLITDEPSNPMTDWHLWSTNNAENFVCIDRTWLTDSVRSDAASRKMVYYKTNGKGQITTILVPSMPEDNPESKIKMIRNFDGKEGKKTSIFQEYWPKWFMNGSYVDYTEPMYSYAGKIIWFNIWSENYDEDDYKIDDSGYWVNNSVGGRTWHQAQLYRIPGSKTVEFIITNPWKVNTGKSGVKAATYIFKDMEETDDGYILNAYRVHRNNDSSNLKSFKVKKDLRLFENIWVSGMGADSERLTEENIMYYEGETPYNVAYESDVMGNQSTPYVEPGVLETGDIIRVIAENNEIVYLEPLWRKSVGTVEAWNETNGDKPSSFFERGSLAYGEIVDINSQNGTVKIRGWHWGRPDEPISSASAGYVKATGAIRQQTIDLFVYDTTAVWDEEREIFGVGTWPDYKIGDKIFVVGTFENGERTDVILIKNHKK